MIIWINGSFGVGKTTIAKELNKRIRESIIYDPEDIGIFLEKILPKKEDFQDYELWRKFNYEILKYFNNNYKNVIVPMTITNVQYYNEIVGRLRQDNIKVESFILIAPKNTLIERLNKRGSTEWAYKQIDRCTKIFELGFDGKKINTDNVSIDNVTLNILKYLYIGGKNE